MRATIKGGWQGTHPARPRPPVLSLAGEANRRFATLDSHMCLTSRIFTMLSPAQFLREYSG